MIICPSFVTGILPFPIWRIVPCHRCENRFIITKPGDFKAETVKRFRYDDEGKHIYPAVLTALKYYTACPLCALEITLGKMVVSLDAPEWDNFRRLKNMPPWEGEATEGFLPDGCNFFEPLEMWDGVPL